MVVRVNLFRMQTYENNANELSPSLPSFEGVRYDYVPCCHDNTP